MAIKQIIIFSFLAYGIGAVVIVALSLLPLLLITRYAFAVVPLRADATRSHM